MALRNTKGVLGRIQRPPAYHLQQRRVSIQEDRASSPLIPQSRQEYGIPTYNALFKYVLDKPSLQPSLFHALAGLEVTTVTRIDEHMNPLQELEHLRTLIKDDKTVQAVSSLRSKDGISVSYQGKSGERVHKGFTKFVESILLPHFDDLRRAFYGSDGTMAFVCKLSNGEYAMVEMQVIPYDFWERRALGYVAAFYGKQMREGEKWKHIKRMIGINILGDGKDSLGHWKGSPAEYMRQCKMQEQLHHPARYIDGIEIIQYSLRHTPEDREQKDWITFFKKASHMTEKDVREKISTPAVLEAFERAKLSTLPDRVREMYDMQESRYAQYSIHTQEVIEEGIAEGRAEGIAEGIAEGRAEGIQMVIEKGIEKGKADAFIYLIKKMKSEGKSNEKMKKRLSLSDEEFQEYTRLIEA